MAIENREQLFVEFPAKSEFVWGINPNGVKLEWHRPELVTKLDMSASHGRRYIP